MSKLFTLFLSLFIGCCAVTAQSKLGKGVARQLADQRKNTIHDVHYCLHFDIPEQRQKSVTGQVTVSFRTDSRHDVVLDFKQRENSVKSLSANGKPSAYSFADEHIVVPRSSLRKGRNDITISFTAADQSLNRNDEYLYTLLVPERSRTLFPCFDQPNMKARFTLSLNIPSTWTAVSNTAMTSDTTADGRRKLTFGTTHPLSTYLFSFVVGKFFTASHCEDGRTLTAYYRETDTKKTAQLDTIFRQVAYSLRWQEEYTGIDFPFEKYDFVILPAFQYGGMEHPGATLFNDRQMFLPDTPTPDEELLRSQLIAHEVSHIWFGDLVTMDWFDDVWTKEVFANYYAARITEPLFPTVNHSLKWLKSYTAYALSTDRTQGTTAIHQQLGNLQDAGLIYGNIVYDKAPVVMRKIVETVGDSTFCEGMRRYLRRYAYANATWDDLIAILDSLTPIDLKAFSHAWVDEKGMPHIYVNVNDSNLVVTQHDPYRRGLTWQQQFDVNIIGKRDTTVCVNLTDTTVTMPMPFSPALVRPNSDGRAYALVTPDEQSLLATLTNWHTIADDTERMAMLMLLNENYHAFRISSADFLDALLRGLLNETTPLIAAHIVSCLPMPLREQTEAERGWREATLFALSQTHPVASCRTQLLRMLAHEMTAPAVIDSVYCLWKAQSVANYDERSYTDMAYELAIRLPQQSSDILAQQRSRIANADRLRQFDFIARAAVPDTLALDTLFTSLLQPANRRVEPWATAMLALLNHPLRQSHAVRYIRPALEAMEEVQRTGDIFMPASWVSALLAGHVSSEAYNEVDGFLKALPNYPELLKTKILQSAYVLQRKWGK